MSRNVFAEIAAATVAGDVERLSALAMEFAMIAERDGARRERQAEKKRRQRASVPGHEGTEGDIGGQKGTPPSPLPPLSSPTPLINPSFPPPPATHLSLCASEDELALEQQVARRLETDADRIGLTYLITVVRLAGLSVTKWLRDILASLDGMPGHHRASAAAMGLALREFETNRGKPNAGSFRRYLLNAARQLESERSPPPGPRASAGFDRHTRGAVRKPAPIYTPNEREEDVKWQPD